MTIVDWYNLLDEDGEKVIGPLKQKLSSLDPIDSKEKAIELSLIHI